SRAPPSSDASASGWRSRYPIASRIDRLPPKPFAVFAPFKEMTEIRAFISGVLKGRTLLTRSVGVLPLAALLCACARAETGDSDRKAIRVANQVMKSLGGRERWDALTGLRWTFQTGSGDTLRPGRTHFWDKRSGW